MTREEVYKEIEGMFGLVPGFIKAVPDSSLELEWKLMKRVQFDEGPIPNKYRELIGVALSAVTKCKYCAYFHTEAAKLNGATVFRPTTKSSRTRCAGSASTFGNTRRRRDSRPVARTLPCPLPPPQRTGGGRGPVPSSLRPGFKFPNPEAEKSPGCKVELRVPASPAPWGVRTGEIAVATLEIPADAKILMVDDDQSVVELMAELLRKQGFQFSSARDGVEGLEKAKEFLPDLIILDISMPRMDGFEVCRRLRGDAVTQRIPVVMFTGLSDRSMRIKGLSVGANDFLTKPVDNTEILVRVGNLLKIKKYQDFLEAHSRILEMKVEERTRQLREALLDTVQRLTLAAEYRDEDTYVHVKRISYYTAVIVKRLGIPQPEADLMFYSSPMHDIGKVGIPDTILLKPGPLTSGEFEIMKTHTTIGARILRGSGSPYLRSAEKFAVSHHERWDGSGYPMGLRGQDIPIEGRILGIIDQYDALRSRRPYKPALDHEEAVRILTVGNEKSSPAQFDPKVLQIFKDCSSEFQDIFDAHGP